jgi:hypothetical protein
VCCRRVEWRQPRRFWTYDMMLLLEGPVRSLRRAVAAARGTACSKTRRDAERGTVRQTTAPPIPRRPALSVEVRDSDDLLVWPGRHDPPPCTPMHPHVPVFIPEPHPLRLKPIDHHCGLI